MIPKENLTELETLCERAKEHTTIFNEALKQQAEAYELNQAGLGRYVRARVADKMDKLKAEQDTVEQLALFFDNVLAQGIRDGSVTVEVVGAEAAE